MAKFLHDDVLDGGPAYLKDNCDKITVCSAQPTTYTEGNATYALADVAVDTTDFTLANGDTSGRKVTVAAQATVPIDTSGNATHVAYLDTSTSKLLGATTCATQALTSGGTVTIPAHDLEVSDPS